MSDNFKELYANLQRQQEELKKQAQEARAEAIAYVQEIITDFQLKASDFTFAEEPGCRHQEVPRQVPDQVSPSQRRRMDRQGQHEARSSRLPRSQQYEA